MALNPGILATGSYLPERRVTNHQLVEAGLDTSDEWIRSHTGIASRCIAHSDQATSDLAYEASLRALDAAGVHPAQLGYIVLATSTPDFPLPPSANLLQDRLGARCGGVDLNGGCSGFVHALVSGFGWAALHPDQPVLVVGADTYSRVVDPEDRRTAVFFGDGAGAVVLGGVEGPKTLLSVVSGSDGSLGRLITIPTGGSRNPARAQQSLRPFVEMEGREVWQFAVTRVPELIQTAVERAGMTLEDIDWFIPHQANALMIREIGERLRVDPERVLCSIQDTGNTASASVAIALHQAVQSGRLREGHRVVVAGFGSGLSWAAACLQWGNTDFVR